MILRAARSPLELAEIEDPEPARGEVRLRVKACGVCRTDLHVLDGELPDPALPLVLGHQIVGIVDRLGEGVTELALGQRVGVPWLGRTCGVCRFCVTHRENLCDAPTFTGYSRNGGFAELTVADARFCFPLPDDYDDAHVAPLLCAGLIGYRALRLAGEGERLGLFGFGAAAHIVIQVARHKGWRVRAFTRPGDERSQALARRLGAEWAGGSDAVPEAELDAAIIFASVGELVPAALRHVTKGGVVVCAGIHMSDIPSFPYDILWGERVVRSVANLTRDDAREFLPLAERAGVETDVHVYPLEKTMDALSDLRGGRFSGAAVVRVTE
ncbi:MAG TPA: zinc-dependent alcohol dehydrogenase family protein [Polyangiaceae bacterium]|nr:zinc-dependent alcohol dehydrogenase family protein [Polyangiaceae bacterium]